MGESENLKAEELAVFEKNVDDVSLAKASQAAASLADALYVPINGISPPKGREEWLGLYKKHVWVYAGIFAIASAIAKLPRKLVKINKTTGDREDIKNHPILALMDYPNPETTGYDWFERGAIHLESCGNAYSEIVYSTKEMKQAGKVVKAKSIPTELWSIRPDRLTPHPEKDGNGIEYWEFQAKKYAKKKKFNPNEILPWGYTDPTQQLFGLGSLQPALDDLRQDVAMASWNLDFFENGMTPQGIFHTEQTLQPNQAKDIADQVKEFLLGGRRVLILGKGMEWQTVSVDPKDTDFLKGRQENRGAVLAALGVPPVKVGLLDNAKYDNYRLQNTAFYQDTILPKLRKIEGAINLFLIPQYPDLKRTTAVDWRFEFDVSGVLAEDADILTDRVIKQLRVGLLTIDEALEMLGYEAVNGEIGGMRLMERGLVKADEMSDEDKNSLETAEDEVIEVIRRHEDHMDEVIEEKVRKAFERRK